jgi:alkylated DNA repair dioxygenase AlkB
MNAQNPLFPEINAAELEPRGFRYCDELISPEEQSALVESLGKLELKPFEFHGYLGNRRVVSFGLKYDYTRREVERASAIPPFLDDLLLRVAEFAGYEPAAFRQVGVNEYRPGAGIGWHKDKPQFGVVVAVSLLAPATLRFRRKQGVRWERISHIVRPGSIYMLAGESRAQWEHSIPSLDQLRYSITFRTVAEGFRLDETGDASNVVVPD